MRKTTCATVLGATGISMVLLTGTATAAGSCQSEALSLGGLNQFLRSQPADSPLPDTIGEFNSALAREMGGLKFGPVAKASTAACRG